MYRHQATLDCHGDYLIGHKCRWENESEPRIEPAVTTALTLTQDEHWPLRPTLCSLFCKKFARSLNNFPETLLPKFCMLYFVKSFRHVRENYSNFIVVGKARIYFICYAWGFISTGVNSLKTRLVFWCEVFL